MVCTLSFLSSNFYFSSRPSGSTVVTIIKIKFSYLGLNSLQLMAIRSRFHLHSISSNTRQLVKKMSREQKYECFLVLDFEATCEEGSRISNPEIIEFPVLKVDAKTFNIVNKFHEYVRPVFNPELSDFCTKLTGITQEMVDESDPFPLVMNRFKSWMNENTTENRFLFVTCGDWDLKSMLPEQCKREKIDLPPYCTIFLNIKKTYATVTGVLAKGMMQMLKELNLQHVGRHHSGIDDCNNIASILRALSEQGCIFKPTYNKHITKPHTKKCYSTQQFHTMSSPSVHVDDVGPSKENYDLNMYPNLKDQNFPPLETPRREGDYESQCKKNLQSDDPRLETKYPVIITRLKESISSRIFSHERENLEVLLASAKYMDLMEEVDRLVIEKQLRYYYIAMSHGWKCAKQDSKNFCTESVGIHVKSKTKSRSHREHGSKHRETN